MLQQDYENMLPQLKTIWQFCFDESAESAGFVFANLIDPSKMLVRTDEGGRPAAMLSWKPLRFLTEDGALDGAYIFGVATLPEYRSRGIAGELMNELHTILQSRDVSLACLVPAGISLFGFYREQGFETEFYYRRLRVHAENIPSSSGCVLSAIKPEGLEKARNEFFAGRGLFGAWDAKFLRAAIWECNFYGGQALRFSCRGRNGYAICYRKKRGGILVKELCASPGDLPALLSALHVRFRADSYELRLPVDFPLSPGFMVGENLPFAMVKWYNVEKRPKTTNGAPWFSFALD